MVQTCCAVKCNNIRDLENGISLHKFPLNNPELLAQWVQAVQRDQWKPTKSSRLCSNHFEEKDFYPGQSVRKLRENAVPTIFAHRPAVRKRSPPRIPEDLESKKVKLNREILKTIDVNVISNSVHSEKVVNSADELQISGPTNVISNDNFTSQPNIISNSVHPEEIVNLVDELQTSGATSIISNDNFTSQPDIISTSMSNLYQEEPVLVNILPNSVHPEEIVNLVDELQTLGTTSIISNDNFTSQPDVISTSMSNLYQEGPVLVNILPNSVHPEEIVNLVDELQTCGTISIISNNSTSPPNVNPALNSYQMATSNMLGPDLYCAKKPGKKERSREDLLSELKCLRQQKKRRDNRIRTLKEFKDAVCQYDVTSDAWDFIERNFSSQIVMLLSNQLKNKGPKQGHRFNDNLLAFANTVHYYSPAAYEFLSTIFTLPSTLTLWRLVDSVECEPGFLSEVFSKLKEDVPLKPYLKDCVLIIDGMNIRKGLRYCVRKQKMVGYVDYGCTSENVELKSTLATEILVIMMVSVTHYFKVPIAYFLSNKVSGLVLQQLIRNSIEKLRSIGISTWGVTFDGAPCNVSCAKALGCVIDKKNQVFKSSFCLDDNQEIGIFFDPCHMIKLARNALASLKVIQTRDGNVEWKYLENLDDLQRKLGLRFANNLTGAHLNFENSKMKVKLAVQVMSSGVADALEFLMFAKHPQFVGASATIKFLRMMDRLFDLLNSKNVRASGYKQPLSLRNHEYWSSVLRDSEQYLRSLKNNGRCIVETKKATFIFGLIFCIRSTEIFARNLLQRPEQPLQLIKMYTISQDHLELFFGTLRRRNGQNNNPDPVQVRNSIKRMLLKNEVTASAFGNIAVNSSYAINILEFRCKKKKNDKVDDDDDEEEFEDEETIFFDEEVEVEVVHMFDLLNELNIYHENILYYIAGYIVLKLMPRIKCVQCKQALIAKPDEHPVSSDPDRPSAVTPATFTRFVNRGKLILPSNAVFEVVKLSEKYLRFWLRDPSSNNGLVDKVVKEILGSEFNTVRINFFAENREHVLRWSAGESLHSTQLIKLVSERYTNLRLKAYAKNFTREIVAKNQTTCRSKCTKVVTFKGF